MRLAIASLGRAAAASAIAACALTIGIAFLNVGLHWTDLLLLQAELTLAVFAIVLLPATMLWFTLARTRHDARVRHSYAPVAVVLFALFWFARLEPAHQVVSIRPHLSGTGSMELVAIGILSMTLLAIWLRASGSTLRRYAGRLGAFAIGSAILAGFALAVEPSRRSDDALARLATRFPAVHGATAPSRVLVVGVDGLEWRTVEWMIAQGRMPTLQRLLATGRFYQHDNHGMPYSPQIWTAIYTGEPTRQNAVGEFVKWEFRGVSRPIVLLPRYGAHAWFFVDEFIRRTHNRVLWRVIPTSTRDILSPPIWSIASAAGRRVGVFNPVPQIDVPETVTGGFFAVPGPADTDVIVVAGGTTRVESLPTQDSNGGRSPNLFSEIDAAAELFSRQRLDLGIYYTHFIDVVQHESWDYAFRGRFFGGGSAAFGDRFDSSPIRDAYDTADQMIARLIKGFGAPATVIVVSDHGWRYNDYEHFRSPHGMLVISPAETSGYAGVADVLGVAPTVLGLLHVPADETMTRPVPPYTVARTQRAWAGVVTRQFVDPAVSDDGRAERLRSLGYIR